MPSIRGIDPGTGEGIEVAVADGRIAHVAPARAEADVYVAPGLVDLQVNGYAGHDLNDGALQPGTVGLLARALLARGVTTFLPTLITAAQESLLSALRAIAAAVETDAVVRRMVAGIHVEGPFIDPADGPRGAHPRAHVRPPSLAEFEAWQAAAGGRVRLVTLSPHWPDSEAFIAQVTRRGTLVAIGHSNAAPEEVRRAVQAGARLSTHLGNGVAAMLPRHPNLVWAQLAEDRLTASFIADGHHLPPDTLTAMIRAKGIERSVLVSDSVALGGLEPGRYEQPVGGTVELSPDGRLGIAGTVYLAGAARNLAENVALAAELGGLPLHQALRMATTTPGALLGGLGRLEPGCVANLIVFTFEPGDPRLTIREVWLAGERAR